MLSDWQARLLHIGDQINLWYLGLLPAVATFVLLAAYGSRFMFLILIGGAAAVGVYLAVVYNYSKPPQTVPISLLTLLDGPLFVLLSLRNGGSPWAFAIEGYLVDGTAVWIAILILAMRSPLPERWQRVASVAFMLAAIATTSSLFRPYIQTYLWGDWGRLLWLALGVVEATAVRYLVLERATLSRDGDGSFNYLLPLLLIWVLFMFLGSIGHELRWFIGLG
ncbi:MAG: hypothetical protein ACE5E7_17775 [Anaerolineae bacterium]